MPAEMCFECILNNCMRNWSTSVDSRRMRMVVERGFVPLTCRAVVIRRGVFFLSDFREWVRLR